MVPGSALRPLVKPVIARTTPTASNPERANATTGDVTWVNTVASATQYTSTDAGTLDGEFTGLSDGSYVLEEVKAPDGYNEIDPDDDSLKVTIAATSYDSANTPLYYAASKRPHFPFVRDLLKPTVHGM